MHRTPQVTITLAAGLCAMLAMSDIAMARGGGAGNTMNSPGYQRRLQESRGFVTTYSNGYPQRGPLYYYRHPRQKPHHTRIR